MGDVSQFSVACESFSQAIFEKSDIEQKNLITEEDMRNYFVGFSKESANEPNHKDINSYSKFMAKRIYKGYMDDPRNTVKFLRITKSVKS